MKAGNPVYSHIIKNDMLDDLLNYALYMFWTKGFSLYNCAVLLVQRSGLGYVATEQEWKKRDRQIKPDARPLLALNISGPLGIYYEACDTISINDEPLPKWMQVSSCKVSPSILRYISLNNLIFLLNRHGIYYGEEDAGERFHGSINYYSNQTFPVTYPVRRGKETKYQTPYALIIRRQDEEQQKIATIFHEIGHLLCGHLTKDKSITETKKFDCNFPDRSNEHLTEAQKEFEAEKVCEIVMKVLNSDYNSSEYLSQYTGEEPIISLDIVMKAADRLLTWMNKTLYIGGNATHY